jgi:hypothetical protein
LANQGKSVVTGHRSLLLELSGQSDTLQQFHRKEKYVTVSRMAVMPDVVDPADIPMGHLPG